MKKIIYFVTALSIMQLVTSLSSCGPNKQELALQDSLRREDSIKAEIAREDSLWKIDSLQKVSLTSNDLTFFELHGPVHSMNNSLFEKTYVFDQDGNLVTVNGYNPFTSDGYDRVAYRRNNQGQIKSYTEWESGEEYKWSEGRVVSSEGGGEGGYEDKTTYSYNEDGTLKSLYVKMTSYIDPSENENYTVSYTYLEFDEYNNWTKRKSKSGTETRTITYFPILKPSKATDNSEGFNPQKNTYMFIGKIGSDKGSSLVVNPQGGQVTTTNGTRDLKFNSYDKATGKLLIDAYYQGKDQFIGQYDGTFDESAGIYKGTFTNNKGGKADFELKLQ